MEKVVNIFLYFLIHIIIFLFIIPSNINAISNDRIVTVVNPVRGIKFWQNKNALEKQASMIASKKIPSTWLLTYEAFHDPSVIDQLKEIRNEGEIGIFLEVDEKLTEDASVGYLEGDGDWAAPKKVLLSGYDPYERKLMLDTIFQRFKYIFGNYPKSVGAWYIDAISLEYIREKYQVEIFMDVSDQYITDKYGLWGKPYGTFYFVSKTNPLLPAIDNNFDNLLKIQWAQRDLGKGLGKNVYSSTFSMQANDYIAHHNLGIDYFSKLVSDYLLSPNDITQITIGLEGGQEGDRYLKDLEMQLDYLLNIKNAYNLKFLTMQQFNNFVRTSKYNNNIFLRSNVLTDSDDQLIWYSNNNYRIGLIKKGDEFKIIDIHYYPLNMIYADLHSKDNSEILKRYLPNCLQYTKDNSILLISDVFSIDYQNLEDNIIQFRKSTGESSKLYLYKDEVKFNNKQILTVKNSFKDRFLNFLLVKIFYKVVEKPINMIQLKYTYINNKYYYGLVYKNDLFFGLTSEYPFIVNYKFKKNILAFFKTIPSLSYEDIFLKYFSNIGYRCKISI
jgi:hypothetical protein